MTRKLGRISVFLSALSCVLAFADSAAAQTLQFNAHKDFSIGYGPASVSSGDFNGDHVADLASANHLDNTAAVLLGNADGTFQPPRTVYLSANHSPRSLTVADFNGDGKLDLALAVPASNVLLILPGNGDGTFQVAGTVAVGGGPACAIAGDFDGDGRADLATANGASNDVSVLLGNGDGTFSIPRHFSADNGPSFITQGDFNRDSRTDVAVANAGSGRISVLLGNGDGTLQAPRTIAPGNTLSVWSIAVGDFNRDGSPDLAAANNAADTVSVLLGNGDGTFQLGVGFDSGSGPTSAVAGDFNRDGTLDLAVANERDGTIDGAGTISVLVGNGDGSFRPPLTFAVGSISWSLAVGNFDGDDVPDLAVANTYSTTVSVLLGYGDGTFPAALTVRTGHNPEGLAAGDLNGDGRADLAVSNAGSNTVTVLLGNGNGTFQPAITFPAGHVPVFLAIGDFNGDGRPDLVVADYGSNHYYAEVVASTVSVLIGNGDGTFVPGQSFEAGSGPHGIAIGDFNRDGTQDLAVANMGAFPQRATTVAVLLGQGDATFSAPQTFDAGIALTGVATGDFNSDGRLDLALSSGDDATVSVLLGNGDGSFQAAVHVGVGSAPKSVAVDDLNGDGRQDLIVTDHFSDTISVLLGNGDGTFLARQAYNTGRNPAWVSAGDLNGDGLLDLAVADWFATTVTVLVGRGDGTFQPSQAFGAGSAPEKAVLADFDGDGQLDVAVANYFSGSVSVLLNRTSMPRAVAPTFSPPGGVYEGEVMVTLSTATPDATIHYTTDGSTPTIASPVYGGPIELSRSTTIRALTAANGMANSLPVSATYTLRAAAPRFSVPAGTYDQPQSVALSTTTDNAVIRYTTDGSAPTPSSPVYTGPIAVTRTMTLRAIAIASGMAESVVASATYTLQAAAPTFNPPGGNYLLPQLVELRSVTPGAQIYYTTDGSTPTTSSNHYSGPILVVFTTTVRAIAAVPGWSSSVVASATYRILFP